VADKMCLRAQLFYTDRAPSMMHAHLVAAPHDLIELEDNTL